MKIFASAPRPLLPIAGGTDLLLDLEQGRHAPARTLVDVTAVADVNSLPSPCFHAIGAALRMEDTTP